MNKQYQDFNAKIQGLDNKSQSLRKQVPLKTCIYYKQFHRNVTFQEIKSNKSPEGDSFLRTILILIQVKSATSRLISGKYQHT